MIIHLYRKSRLTYQSAEPIFCHRMGDGGEFRMQIVKIIITYNDLRTEREDNVRAIMGKNGYELYREYFGEVEEA